MVGTRGRFDRGDTIGVLTQDNLEVARGIAAYSDSDASKIMGRKSLDIERMLGFRGRDEMIHRDNLVMLDRERPASGILSTEVVALR